MGHAPWVEFGGLSFRHTESLQLCVFVHDRLEHVFQGSDISSVGYHACLAFARQLDVRLAGLLQGCVHVLQLHSLFFQLRVQLAHLLHLLEIIPFCTCGLVYHITLCARVAIFHIPLCASGLIFPRPLDLSEKPMSGAEGNPVPSKAPGAYFQKQAGQGKPESCVGLLSEECQ